jgi:predicted acyltransferase (DUF342 family)
VQIRSDPLDELAIPDGTTVEEHDLVTDGDVLVGGQSEVEFGIRGSDVVAGERVAFGGHIEAGGDCRLDMWTDVAEDVLVGGDAYLGERVAVGGELKVAGNLDIGDDVDIEEGFEANGWITIRNPMPTVVFLVVYLSQLLRIGEEEAADQLASELLDTEAGEDRPVVIPRGARVGDETWRVSTPATVGDDCRLHGNLRAERLTVGSETVVFGSLRARGDVDVGADTEIKGDVTTRSGDVRVGRGAHVWGDISAEDVKLHEHAVVEGRIRVGGELTQMRDPLRPDAEADADADPDGSGTSDETRDPDSWGRAGGVTTAPDGGAGGYDGDAETTSRYDATDAEGGEEPVAPSLDPRASAVLSGSPGGTDCGRAGHVRTASEDGDRAEGDADEESATE